MKNKIDIKKGDVSDIGTFYSLWEKSLKEGYFLYRQSVVPYILEQDLPKGELRKNLKSGKQTLYLAFIGKNLTGYLLTKKQDGGVSFGHWLAVHAGHRNLGIASKLLSAWEVDARNEGAHKLDLYTTRNDVEFYKKRGFILAGECPDCWYGVDHFWFYKTLRKSDEKLFLKEFLESKIVKSK